MGNEAIGAWDNGLFESFLGSFCRRGVASITRIGVWLQMQELKELIEHSSWKFPYAAFCRDDNYSKLIFPGFWKNDVFQNQQETFGKFYEMVISVSLDTFLTIYPTLVKQSKELLDLRSKRDNVGTPYTDDKQWGYCIFGAIYTYENYLMKRCEATEMTTVFQNYLKSQKISIPDEIAFNILVFTTMYSFSSRKRKETINAMEAYEKLEEGHCTPMKMLEIYKDVHKIIQKDKEYGNESRYIKAAKGQRNFRM